MKCPICHQNYCLSHYHSENAQDENNKAIAIAGNESRLNMAKKIVELEKEIILLKAKIENMELEEMARAIVDNE